MTIHEYGKSNEKTIVMIHLSVAMWDYFECIIPLLEKKYHLVIPALPGYDENCPEQDFTSVEAIADDLAKWPTSHGIHTVDVLYGCSAPSSYIMQRRYRQGRRMTGRRPEAQGPDGENLRWQIHIGPKNVFSKRKVLVYMFIVLQ